MVWSNSVLPKKLQNSTMSCEVEIIPLEVWEVILGKLSLRDLCQVISTSRHLNCLASHPAMWAGMGVKKWKIQEDQLSNLFTIERFARTRKIDLSQMRFTTKQLESMFEVLLLSRVEDLDLRDVDLSQVQPDLLARTISRLRKASLKFNNLTSEQTTAILTSSLSSQTLEELIIQVTNLSGVTPELVGKAVSRLKRVDLTNINLPNDVSTAILEASLGSTTLKSLNLSGNDLSRVQSDLLSKSVSRLQQMDLTCTSLSKSQWEAILVSCAGSTTLKEMTIDGTDLSIVSPQLLARAICCLPKIDLTNTQLTTDHCTAILTACLESSNKLKEINLESVSLSDVSAELIAKAFQAMEKIGLYNTSLTAEQCQAILTSSLVSNSLQEIYIQSPDLKSVSPDILANAVSRLTKSNLTHNDLTTEHWEAVLTSSLRSNTLQEMNLNCVDLSSVSPELLASAVLNLRTASLMDTSLTPTQSTAILELIKSSSKLESEHSAIIQSSSRLETLNLAWVDLSEVDSDLLATALAGLKHVHLGKNYMSSDQCTFLLSASINSRTLATLEINDMDMVKNEENEEILKKAKQKFSHLYELDYTGQGCQIC